MTISAFTAFETTAFQAVPAASKEIEAFLTILDESESTSDDNYYSDVDEDDFIEGATSTCPWQFKIPADLVDKLHKDKKLSYSDHDPAYKKSQWSLHWPNITPDVIDPAQSAADYYLLFGLVNNAFVDFEPLEFPSPEKVHAAALKLGKTVEEAESQIALIDDLKVSDYRYKLTQISASADVIYHNLVENLDRCFREYVHLACGGELRHHGAITETLTGYRRGAWVRWYYIFEEYGPEALLTMAELFEEFTGGTYGGPPWANAARILYDREVGNLGPDEFTNKQLFVDRVFTLEHNGGCFLNKIDWINLRGDRPFPYSVIYHNMGEYVLNAHASNPTDIDMLLGFASNEIATMTEEYLSHAKTHGLKINGYWKGDSPVFDLESDKPSETKVKSSDKLSVLNWDEEESFEKTNYSTPQTSIASKLQALMEEQALESNNTKENLKELFPPWEDMVASLNDIAKIYLKADPIPFGIETEFS